MKIDQVWTMWLLSIGVAGLIACGQNEESADATQSDISDTSAVVSGEQTDAAKAFCEALDPPTPGPMAELPRIHLLGLDVNPEKDENHYIATFDAVDGAAKISFPMAICPLSSANIFRGVRCQLWVGGIATFEREEILLAHLYKPCEFSNVPPGTHDVKIALCCFNQCSNGLETCNYGDAWVSVTVE